MPPIRLGCGVGDGDSIGIALRVCGSRSEPPPGKTPELWPHAARVRDVMTRASQPAGFIGDLRVALPKREAPSRLPSWRVTSWYPVLGLFSLNNRNHCVNDLRIELRPAIPDE